VIHRFVIWVIAGGLRRGVPAREMEHMIARAFRHRDQAWRDQLLADARGRNRKRTMMEAGL
jgi:hypothetical protein